jgi:hypothetical protein
MIFEALPDPFLSYVEVFLSRGMMCHVGFLLFLKKNSYDSVYKMELPRWVTIPKRYIPLAERLDLPRRLHFPRLLLQRAE